MMCNISCLHAGSFHIQHDQETANDSLLQTLGKGWWRWRLSLSVPGNKAQLGVHVLVHTVVRGQSLKKSALGPRV